MTEAVIPDTSHLVVVTGAGRGIGRAIALDLAARCSVLCISQSRRCEETAEAIRRLGGNAAALMLDLGNAANVREVMHETITRLAPKKIGMVLAAAILGPQGPLEAAGMDEWERTFSVNVFGNLAVVHALMPFLKQHRHGRILFFAGGGAAYEYPIFPAYAASKAALVRIAENLHEDLQSQGDFATAILAPGAVETDTLATVRASGALIKTTVGIEEPVAFARAFLLSKSCGFSGRFVHVRDAWQQYIDTGNTMPDAKLWKLRRYE